MKTVYADIKDTNGKVVRVCGRLGSDSDMVMVNIVKGSSLGGFYLSRFEGGKLTSKTLKNLFEG